MYKRRSYRRAGRARRVNPYEMQQLTSCRTGVSLTEGTWDCSTPRQYLTTLVSPRLEFGTFSGVPGQEQIPPFAKGVTVGGLRFRYSYSVNMALAVGNWAGFADIIDVRSALVVLPLSDLTTNAPGFFPTNMLFQNGTIPEAGGVPTPGVTSGYTRPRILWRGLDMLLIKGPVAGSTAGFDAVLDTTVLHGSGTDLQIVKSKVSLGHNDCLYFLTEIATGFVVDPTESIPIALDLFGVAAVKPTTATRP